MVPADAAGVSTVAHIKEWFDACDVDRLSSPWRPMLRSSLRNVIVYDQLFDVGQFPVEILAAFLLFPVAWELL